MYLTVNQIAERYSVRPETIYAWVRKKRFPSPVKLSPGCSRWRVSDVDEWERERTHDQSD